MGSESRLGKGIPSGYGAATTITGCDVSSWFSTTQRTLLLAMKEHEACAIDGQQILLPACLDFGFGGFGLLGWVLNAGHHWSDRAKAQNLYATTG
jgi:hypothetical protein